MAADAVFAGSARDGRLNPVFTLGLAAAGTALVLAGLLFAFSRQITPPLTSASMLVRVVQSPVAVPVPVRAAARESQAARATVRRSPHPIAPHLPSLATRRLQKLAAPIPSKLDLSPNLPSPLLPLPGMPGPQAFNPYSDLERALQAPPKPATMQNNSSFRSIYGFPVSKVGGVCSYSVPIEHLSLSPSVHPHVAFVVPCPGSHQPTMGDELKAWAEKEKKKQDGNGSG